MGASRDRRKAANTNRKLRDVVTAQKISWEGEKRYGGGGQFCDQKGSRNYGNGGREGGIIENHLTILSYYHTIQK